MFILLGATIILTNSNGGMIAFLFGVCIFCTLILIHPRELSRKWILAGIGIALLVAIGLGLYLGYEDVMRKVSIRLARLQLEGHPGEMRLLFWRDALDIIPQQFLTGTGAGSFSVIYTMHQSFGWDHHVTHPENLIVRIFLELGLITGGILLLTYTWTMCSILFHSRKGAVEFGLFSALFSLIAANMVDFSLTLLSLSVPFVSLFAILYRRSLSTQRSNRGKPPLMLRYVKLPVLPAVGMGIFLILLSIGGWLFWKEYRVESDRRNMHAASHDESLSDDSFHKSMLPIIRRHPADYYTRLLLAERYSIDKRSELPMRLYHQAKAIILNPYDPMLNRRYAHSLTAAGNQDKALIHLARAIDGMENESLISKTFSSIVKLGMPLGRIEEYFSSEQVSSIHKLAAFLISRGKTQEARLLLAKGSCTTSRQKRREAHLVYKSYRLDVDYTGLLENSLKRLEADPTDLQAFAVAGEASYLLGMYDRSITYFKSSLEHGGPNRLYHSMAKAALRKGDIAAADEYLSKVLIRGKWGKSSSLLADWILQAEIDIAGKNYQKAISRLKKAQKIAETDWRVYRLLGQVYATLGKTEESLKNYRLAIGYAKEDGEMETAKKLQAFLQKLIKSYSNRTNSMP